jgi:ATP-dependent Clp protease ATP-binding subunit ClpA
LRQEEAIKSIVAAVKRAMFGLGDASRPICSCLFAGPTGVGKTEIVKTFNSVFYGGGSSLKKLDMSEFMERHSVSKLIGSPPGYVGYLDSDSLVSEMQKDGNISVLFDEVEKAHPDIFNILLQVLEEGILTETSGSVADFRNATLFLTSNLGAKEVLNLSVVYSGRRGVSGRSTLRAEMKRALLKSLRNFFRPELLNRLDEIVVFNPLSPRLCRKILKNKLRQLHPRLAAIGISLRIRDTFLSSLLDSCVGPSRGARAVRFIMKRHIIDPIAEGLMKGTLCSGKTVLLGKEKLGLDD